MEEALIQASERRFATPERAPPAKRRVELDDDGMGVGDGTKSRLLPNEAMIDSTNRMSDEDARILSSVVVGVDLAELCSPIRVAAVAAKLGLTAGTSFDFTNGLDF